MPITRDDVVRALSSEEPDYERAALRLGPEALPHLDELVRGADSLLAAKAVALASLLGGDAAAQTLMTAAQRREPQVRVAVAAVARRLDAPAAKPLLQGLLADADPGVRKVAIRSAASARTAELGEKVRELAARDPAPHNRKLAARVLAVAYPKTPR